MLEKLPPRERELVDALYAKGEATAADLRAALSDPPSDSAVRAMLSRLVQKGFVRYRRVEQRYVYTPRVPEAKAARSALRQVMQSFFGGSPVGAATALIGMADDLDDEALDTLAAAIEQARRGVRK